MSKQRYSLGPELCHLLACDSQTMTTASQHEFERTVAMRLQQGKLRDVVALVAELMALRLPLLVLKLLATHAKGYGDNFTLFFWRGAADMATGDLLRAKKNFSHAHRLCPEEIAVHSNLATILRTEGNSHAAQQWLQAGLRVERNAAQLWLAMSLLCEAKELLALAEELLAWRGGSLYAQLTGDVTAALTLYRRVFAGGARDGEFLIEFSGALGHQNCHTELGALAWQVLGQEVLPWQVYEHFAQGFTQLNNTQQAQRCAVLAQNARAHSSR